MSKLLRILNVEDSALDADLVKRAIEKGGIQCQIVRVETHADYVRHLEEFDPDIILADYSLPHYSGPDALNYIRAEKRDIPFIFISGSLGEELAIDTLKQGATDYVLKERLDRLVPSIQRALQEAADRKARLEAEQALRKSEELYRRLVENARDGIFTLTPEGCVSSMNQACEIISGWTREQAQGKAFVDFIHPGDRANALEWLQRSLEQDSPPMIELRVLSADGKQRTMEVTSTRLQDELNTATGILCIGRDITERHHLEEQLRQAQKMESIGQLAGGVAHDFNNLLTVIQGHAALIIGDSELPRRMGDGMREVARATERAASLTRQLLAFSRKQPLQIRELNLNEVVSEITRMLQRVLGEPVTLHCEYCPSLPVVKADQSMLEQVILNLAVNARDAMPKGGVLTLRTNKIHRSNISPSGMATDHEGPFVSLTAHDNGDGIPAEIQSRIFEPFFTTKEPGKGTGLGLATVYGIVKQHGGWVDVHSAPGTGTSFTVYLPASSTPAAAKEKSQTIPSVSGGTECILVVEDEVAVRGLCRRILERQGYTVLTAENGVEALKVWSSQKDKIELLLTDMVMPEGMTGRELADILRKDNPNLPIILSTGYSPDFLDDQSLQEEGIQFLAKPYGPNDLAVKIRQCLGGKKGTD